MPRPAEFDEHREFLEQLTDARIAEKQREYEECQREVGAQKRKAEGDDELLEDRWPKKFKGY